MSRIDLVRIDDSNYFAVPAEKDVEGVRIREVIIDNNTLPSSAYRLSGPRKVGITIRVPDDIIVSAEIDEL